MSRMCLAVAFLSHLRFSHERLMKFAIDLLLFDKKDFWFSAVAYEFLWMLDPVCVCVVQDGNVLCRFWWNSSRGSGWFVSGQCLSQQLFKLITHDPLGATLGPASLFPVGKLSIYGNSPLHKLWGDWYWDCGIVWVDGRWQTCQFMFSRPLALLLLILLHRATLLALKMTCLSSSVYPNDPTILH